MNAGAPMLSGFVDELEKIAAAHGRTHVAKSRLGRRPISVARLLKKDNAGTLFKKHADSAGAPQDVRGAGADDPGAARAPRRAGEVPTKEPNLPESAKLGELDPVRAMFRAFDRYYKTAEPVRGDVSPLTLGESPMAYQEAKKPRKRGDVPSRDDVNVIDRYDARENATTVHGLGQHSTGIAVGGGEHS